MVNKKITVQQGNPKVVHASLADVIPKEQKEAKPNQ